MSQNTLVTASSIGEVRVSAGWDFPLQHLFCNVLPLDDEGDEDEDEDADVPAFLVRNAYGDVPELVATLKAGGIELPQQMVDAIQQDVDANARNVLRIFNADGTIKEEHRF